MLLQFLALFTRLVKISALGVTCGHAALPPPSLEEAVVATRLYEDSFLGENSRWQEMHMAIPNGSKLMI